MRPILALLLAVGFLQTGAANGAGRSRGQDPRRLQMGQGKMGQMGMGSRVGKDGKDWREEWRMGMGKGKGKFNKMGKTNLKKPFVPKVLSKLPTFNANGTDVNKTGACMQAISSLCPDVEWGDARVASCLRDHKATAASRREPPPMDKRCMKELSVFLLHAASQNYKKQDNFKGKGFSDENLLAVAPAAGFREACREDSIKHCPNALGSRLLPCLRSKKRKLKPECRDMVFVVQKQEAEDMAFDVPFMAACYQDLQNIEDCRNVMTVKGSVGGAKKSCLKKHRDELSANCSLRLFRREQEDSEDIRLSQGTYTACKGEITAFCGDKEFGEGRMVKCLWETKRKVGFGVRCKRKIEQMTQYQASDYRLDFRIRTRCKQDIQDFCAEEKQRVDNLTVAELFGQGWEGGASGEVLRCLKTNYTRLSDDMCKQEIQRLVSIQALDAEADPVLSRACREDIDSLCSEVKPEEVHHCLRNNWDKISEDCSAEELLQGQLEGSDISMNPILKDACGSAVKQFCGEVTHGEARVIECLHGHEQEADMPLLCKKALEKESKAANNDWRLKFGIHHSCKSDAERICKPNLDPNSRVSPVLKCLRQHLKQLKDDSCAREMKKLMKQSARDIHSSPDTMAACVDDVSLLCADVKPGGGRVHACLLDYRYELSEECAKAEFEEQKMGAEDPRLNPKVMKRCKPAMKALCKDVPYEDGQMWRCLEDKKDHEDMPRECAEVISKMTRLKNEEFFLNPKLAAHCVVDAKALCPDEYAQAQGEDFSSRGGVIGCLIEKREKVSDPKCMQDLKRKMLQRSKDIKNDPKQFEECSADIDQFCSAKSAMPRTSGEVHLCLQDHLSEISAECKGSELMNMKMQSEDVGFNPAILKACRVSLDTLCMDDFRVGCLLDHMQDEGMDSACRKVLETEQKKRTKSIFFNPGLQKACKKDLMTLRRSADGCGNSVGNKAPRESDIGNAADILDDYGGKSIDCLTQNMNKLQSPDCQREVSMVLKRQAKDYRAKPRMESACGADVARLCPGVAVGEGRIHHCLRQHLEEIESESCKSFVKEVQDAESDDAAINPQVAKKCKNEMHVYCADISPGEARLLACLGLNRKKTGFSSPCKRALQRVKANADVLANADQAMKEASADKGLDSDAIAQEIKEWLDKNKGFLESWGPLIIAGVGLMCACGGAIAMYCVVASQCKKGGYVTVVPRDLES